MPGCPQSAGHTSLRMLRLCIDGSASRQHHARERVLPHNKRLNDCFTPRRGASRIRALWKQQPEITAKE